MAQQFKWKVIREHTGDRDYFEGDERIGTKADLGALEGTLLKLIGPADFGGKGDHDGDGKTGGAKAKPEEPEEDAAPPSHLAAKAEDEPLNKAEPAAPANKAASSRKSKSK